MKLNNKELSRIIEDLSQCERRDNTTISRSDYSEKSRAMAQERQQERGPLLTKLRLIRDTAEEAEA